MRLLVPLFLATLVSCQEYVPGTPGGAWSAEELMIVRAKLFRLFTNNFITKFSNQFTKIGLPKPNFNNDLSMLPAKVLRLSFHDCVRYADGSGGCDGCLNWSGVGHRFPNQKDLKFSFQEKDVHETNNNGLEYIAAILEQVYLNPEFPPEAEELPVSLKASGKSRADLWAYAAKVAIEFTIERNNYLCEDKPADWLQTGSSYVGNEKECLRNVGEEDCEVSLPREISFQSGRSDCVSEYSGELEQYKTDKPEKHPNPNGNGDATLDFFSEEFGFSGRETVAIMGAHTLGQMHSAISLLKYVWTVRSGSSFNNAYYKNIVKKNEWFLESKDGDTCSFVGDAYGTLPDTKWVPTMNGFTEGGGPMHWIRMHYACNYCGQRPNDGGQMDHRYDKCCPGRPEGLACIPDNATRNDVDDIEGCERYRFAFGKDEMMMNAEAGLYFKFDVNDAGIPINCPGFENFNMDAWTARGGTKDPIRRAYNMDCPLNDRSLPETDKPVSEIIKDYAADQQQWVGEFIDAFEKMTRNGVDESDLTESPSSWGSVQCKLSNKLMTCTNIA